MTTCRFETQSSWVILSRIEQLIKAKIEALGKPLRDWDVRINYGIKTGFNDAFIITSEVKETIIANCKTADEKARTIDIIRPILRGRDIMRYSYHWCNLWIIGTFPSKEYNIELFPAIKKHLLSFGIERLEQTGNVRIINGAMVKARKLTNNKWFETQDSINYWNEFSKPKIIYPNITKYLPFVYDTDGFYTNQKCFILTGNHVAYLTAFLNSSLFKYCYRDVFPELLGGTRELSKIFFEKIAAIDVSDEINTEFESLIEDIQKEYSIEKHRVIDEKVFDLYNLSIEERNTVGFIQIK